ncbi:MAG: flavodoxin family protein [Chloroflexi bacterium]|nr:MAG: flavodoxin family protein [Chloroflexota bacterium]
MNVLYVSGSPRKDSNTDYLLELMLSLTGGQFVKLTDYQIEPCRSCWACRRRDECMVDDDMSRVLIPMLFAADAMVLGSPVYFNNVSAQLKAFIDRTWSIKGKLRNKIGGAVVVGRRYGAESAVTAINAFFLKHEMLPANRGVSGIAFASGDVQQDREAVEAAKRLAERIIELGDLLRR